MKTKDRHKQPTITVRLDSPEQKAALEKYAADNRVSVSWIVKKAIDLFWIAVKKGDVKL